MFKWLNGPGANFKNPLPGSTNYLNAYDASGKLIRATQEDSKRRSYEDTPATEDGDIPSISEMNLQGDEPLPPESLDDLMPFPLNREFRSQPVLSEEFKQEIYDRVVKHGHPVRRVSSELQVEMRRVGAVVRLKAVEEQWKQEVCSHLFFPPSKVEGESEPLSPATRVFYQCPGHCNDETNTRNSISLEDLSQPWLPKQINYNSLNSLLPSLSPKLSSIII